MRGCVDELGAIQKQLAPLRSLIAREEKLKREIRAAHDGFPADREIPLAGAAFTAVLGAKGMQTVINLPKLIKIIKAAGFAKFATCTLQTLCANVAEPIYEGVTSLEQTGPRSLATFERPAQ